MREYTFKRKIEDKESTSGFRYEEEKVELEMWVWGVVYKDGTELHQFDSEGTFHQFKEIKLDQVKLFSMYQPNDMEDKRYDIVVTEGMQIFHFYRNIQPFYLDHFVKIYAFGWKKDGKASYHFILPDDRMVMSDVDNVDLPQFNLK